MRNVKNKTAQYAKFISPPIRACYGGGAGMELVEADMNCESLRVDPIIARLLAGEGEMRRDDDYLRDLLAGLEASDEWQHLLGFDESPGGDPKLDYHVVLLEDEGFLTRLQPGVYRMTAKAHDFLDHTRDKGIWTSAKATAAKIGDHSITTLMKVAEGMVMAKLREITGLDL